MDKLMTEASKNNYYSRGKFFETFQEMVEALKIWDDEPCDLAYYREFLDERFREAELNLQANPEVTNRTIFKLLRMNTDWVKYE